LYKLGFAEPDARHHQRVAVRRRPDGGLRADIGVCAGTVEHNERLTEALAQALAENAGEQVCAATRGKRNNEIDGA
jgi:hypothetical protein